MKSSARHRLYRLFRCCIPGAMAAALMTAGMAHAQCAAINPASESIGAGGGTGSFTLTDPGAGAAVVSNAAWISGIAPSYPTGGGLISYTVDSNTGAARTGTITITVNPSCGLVFTFTVNQDGVAASTTTTTAAAETTTTTVAQCATFLDCDDGLYCTAWAMCINGRCVPSGEAVCSWSYCDEEQDTCVSSWREGEPCCITTTVFGVHSPEAQLLRRYRDEVLAGNFFGNRFVHVYYFLSPMAVKFLDKSPLLQYMTMRSFRMVLPFVEWHLKKNRGAEN